MVSSVHAFVHKTSDRRGKLERAASLVDRIHPGNRVSKTVIGILRTNRITTTSRQLVDKFLALEVDSHLVVLIISAAQELVTAESYGRHYSHFSEFQSVLDRTVSILERDLVCM